MSTGGLVMDEIKKAIRTALDSLAPHVVPGDRNLGRAEHYLREALHAIEEAERAATP